MTTEMKALQNGSDIRGIAITTDSEKANLTPEAVRLISQGFVQWLRKDNEQKYLKGELIVGIGRDSRLSGPVLTEALIDSLVQQGVTIIDFGLATTPAMFMSTQYEVFDCDASIMLTASHLPYYFNGLKFFTKKGGAEKADIAYILSHLENSSNGYLGEKRTADLIKIYAADLVKQIQTATALAQPLTGVKIIVDAGNGAGGFFANQVLVPLGADTTGSQFLDPDGTFPNHIPNPDNQTAMQSIQQAVLANKADLGIIFDTDVDRSAVVSAAGKVINRNNLIALLSVILLEDYPGTSIVTNSPTSSHLKGFIEQLGGKQVRYISGYRNVINKAIELNQAGIDTQLAIETSGHAAFKENYFLDDGAYVIAKILMLLPKLVAKNQTLDELVAGLKQPVEVNEIRLHIKDTDTRVYGTNAINGLTNYFSKIEGIHQDLENEEGLRFNTTGEYGSGWFLVRMSLHEPLIVIQIENDQYDENIKIITLLADYFGTYQGIDTTNL